MESNKTRRCKTCQRPLDKGQREDAVFCSDKCRVRHYRRHNEQTVKPTALPPSKETKQLNGLPPPPPVEQLKAPPLSGVLNSGPDKPPSNPQEYEWVTVDEPNPIYTQNEAEITSLKNQLQRIKVEQDKIVKSLSEDGWDAAKLLPWVGAGAGIAITVYTIVNRKKEKKNNPWEDVALVLGATMIGALLGSAISPSKQQQEKEKTDKRDKLVSQSQELDKEQQYYEAQLSLREAKKLTLPEFLPQKRISKESQRKKSLDSSEKWIKIQQMFNQLRDKTTPRIYPGTDKTKAGDGQSGHTTDPGFNLNEDEQLQNGQPHILEPDETLDPDGKPRLVNSMELSGMKFKRFNFQGRWLDFLGRPAIYFQCVIYGLPGSGKSTFAAQLAIYLARNFGKVVYVAGEEGISATLQDKVNLTGASNPNLDFADVRHWEQLAEVVPANTYNFMVLDSLHQLGIDEDVLRKLRQHYPNCAFISINQSTKDGKMRGSNVIIHDADISIEVHEGVAVCRKNRFQVTGRPFQVLPKQERKDTPQTDFKEPENLL